MSFTINIKKIHPDAILPKYINPGDAGMDLYSIETVKIKKGKRAKIGTGIAMQLPKGYVSLVWDKSGLATNHGLKVLGGVIDAGYRGEYFVTLVNLCSKDYVVEKGNKIAQVLIQKVEYPKLKEVKELRSSVRGAAGFGSTGK